MTNGRRKEEILHKGEIDAQKRYDETNEWDELKLNQMFHTSLSRAAVEFIQSLPFFFIATSDDIGNCDVSYRGVEFYDDGRRQPPVKAFNRETIVFPDFAGNKLFNSIGNMLINPHIGMLFIDFENSRRLRVNGKVKIIEDEKLHQEIWPGALRYIHVSIEQVFGNCSKRIPKLKQE